MLTKFLWPALTCAVLVSGCARQSVDDRQNGLEMLRQLGAGVDFNDEGRMVFVNLSRRAVTDDQLQCVKGLTDLRQLWLYDVAITDRGLKHVRGLVNLEVLVLGKTRITDRGLGELVRLRNLQELYLYDTEVSAYAVNRLQEALPYTLIIY